MSESAGEKTEAPTPKKLRDAAKKGDVLASRELAVALVMIAGLLWLAISGAALVEALLASIRASLAFDRRDIASLDIGSAASGALGPIVVPLAMLFVELGDITELRLHVAVAGGEEAVQFFRRHARWYAVSLVQADLRADPFSLSCCSLATR